jgi:hypothetical protein
MELESDMTENEVPKNESASDGSILGDCRLTKSRVEHKMATDKTDNLDPSQNPTEDGSPDAEVLRFFKTAKEVWAFIKTQEFQGLAMAISTILIAFFTAATWLIIWRSSSDTQKLIDAAGQQAQAAKDFATYAGQIRDTIRISEKDLSNAADNSKGAITATQDAMRLEQRAWVANIAVSMDAPEVGKNAHGYTTWINSGKSFAKQVKPSCYLVFVQDRIAGEDILNKIAALSNMGQGSIGVLAPNGQYKTGLDTKKPINQVDKDRISGNWYTYVWGGGITYYDIFKIQHSTVFCSYRQGITADFVQCPFHNDAN